MVAEFLSAWATTEEASGFSLELLEVQDQEIDSMPFPPSFERLATQIEEAWLQLKDVSGPESVAERGLELGTTSLESTILKKLIATESLD